MEDFATPPDSFASPPADDPFVGTIDETPMEQPVLLGESPTEQPIILGAPAVETEVEDVQEEVVPSGPSPLQKWNEEWQATLMARKDAENAKKAEYIAAAEEAMKNFHDQRDSKRESKMTKNRADEQEKLEAIEADLENDNSWQRVCKMVELSHDSSEDAVDVKRMRNVMILLKNEPSRATVLA